MAAAGDADQVPLPPGDDDFDDEEQPHAQGGDNPPPPPHAQGGPNPGAPPFVPLHPFQQQFFPWQMPPFAWPPQHAAAVNTPQPHKVKLPSFWPNKPRAWFTHAEAAFDTFYVTDSRQRFNIVLPCLSEDALDGVSALVELPNMLQHPYEALKERLLQIYQPDPWEQAGRLLSFRELGDMKPSQLMNSMLALLPRGEPTGFLFKKIFLDRLPNDVRTHVQAAAQNQTCQQLAAFADGIWQARNTTRSNVAAAVQLPTATNVDSELADLSDAVAAVSVKKKAPQQKKPAQRTSARKSVPSKIKGFVCWKHVKYGEKAHNCEDESHCTFSGNAPAAGW